jgi:hypothetical protein
VAVAVTDQPADRQMATNPDLRKSLFSPTKIFIRLSVMGLLFPGSDGLNREENSLLPYDTVRVPADKSVRVTGLLLGGRGQTVIPAVQEYVRLYGLPPLPAVPGGAAGYLELAARGWLISVRDGDLYRHAAWFWEHAAADAALYEDWLATRLGNADLAARLRAAARPPWTRYPPRTSIMPRSAHPESRARLGVARSRPTGKRGPTGWGMLARFEADGFIRYRKSPDGLDYGRTHWARTRMA